VDFEDSTLIKMFLSVLWFSGKQRQLVVAISGGGGGIRVWVGVWREKE